MLPGATAQNVSGCEPSSEEYEDKARIWAGVHLFSQVWNLSQSMWICLYAYVEITSDFDAITMAKTFLCNE